MMASYETAAHPWSVNHENQINPKKGMLPHNGQLLLSPCPSINRQSTLLRPGGNLHRRGDQRERPRFPRLAFDTGG
jgi:hypothetical protein